MTEYASQLRDFPDLLKAAAQSRNLPTAIVEKDYYLTRVLCVLAQAHAGQFILKGGTSLSKGWQLLRRFSEDIDLLPRADPGWGETRRDKRLKAFEQTVAQTESFSYAEKVREASRGVHRTIIFHYPGIANDLPGLSKTIRLEMGYRGQAARAVRRPVRSMVAEFAASRGEAGLARDLRPFEIDLQNLSTTFVEKLLAAYAAYENGRAAHNARHYYDLYELCALPEVRAFAGSKEYPQVMGEAKRIAEQGFHSPVPPGDSLAGWPAFTPKGDDLLELESNYKREMAGLLLTGTTPPLADVLAKIQELLPKL